MNANERILSFLVCILVIVYSKGVPFYNSIGYPGDCNFENGLCSGDNMNYGYTNDRTGQFVWSRGNGSTPSDYTGPTHDHTLGAGKRGNYLYVESSNPRLNGDRARIISTEWLRPISRTITTCIRFYYHMKGHTIGILRVYLQYVEMNNPTLVWQLKGNQGEEWKEAKVKLDVKKPFKIIFEGETSYSYLGDIAIDDIDFFSDRSCFIWPPHARPTDEDKSTLHVPNSPAPAGCGIKPPIGRITGGQPAKAGDWPWQAMIVKIINSTYKEPRCGATLIWPNWAVTAAHCVDDMMEKEKYEVRLGANKRMEADASEQNIKIMNVYIHPKFNSVTMFNYDVALIRLARPAIIDVNRRTGMVCLPVDAVNFTAGKSCWITGWGRLWEKGPHPYSLLEGDVPLVSNQECLRHMESYPGQITDNMLCAGYGFGGGIDTCRGDSGGPLVCDEKGKWYLVGITSWGVGCGRKNTYGVYSRVTKLRSWMDSVIAYPDKHEKAN